MNKGQLLISNPEWLLQPQSWRCEFSSQWLHISARASWRSSINEDLQFAVHLHSQVQRRFRGEISRPPNQNLLILISHPYCDQQFCWWQFWIEGQLWCFPKSTGNQNQALAVVVQPQNLISILTCYLMELNTRWWSVYNSAPLFSRLCRSTVHCHCSHERWGAPWRKLSPQMDHHLAPHQWLQEGRVLWLWKESKVYWCDSLHWVYCCFGVVLPSTPEKGRGRLSPPFRVESGFPRWHTPVIHHAAITSSI